MSGQSRELFIDATRGLAMVGVMVAHFCWVFAALHPEFEAGLLIAKLVKPAAPTFMLISGALLGYIYERRNHHLGAFATKLMDRGLFLLTAGHVIIWLAYVPYAGGLANAATYGQITDAIGVAIIIGPLIISRLSAPARVALGITGFIVTWIAVIFWNPQGDVAGWVKDTLFGAELGRHSRWGYNFPIAPWVSIYIIATAIGQHLARARERRSDSRFAFHLMLLGAAGIASFLSVRMLWLIARFLLELDTGSSRVLEYIYIHTEPGHKWPPVFSYYLFHCSISLLLLGTMFFIERRHILPQLLSVLTVIGQNSLFIFLVQEHLYVSVLWILSPPLNSLWPVLLVVSILVNILAVYAWRRVGGTHVFTVGYGSIWGLRAAASQRGSSD